MQNRKECMQRAASGVYWMALITLIVNCNYIKWKLRKNSVQQVQLQLNFNRTKKKKQQQNENNENNNKHLPFASDCTISNKCYFPFAAALYCIWRKDRPWSISENVDTMKMKWQNGSIQWNVTPKRNCSGISNVHSRVQINDYSVHCESN